MRRILDYLARRATLLLLVLALLAVTLIGVVGMSASVVVAEAVQGSGSAINVAGSLRRLTHRVGALVVAESLGGSIGRPDIDQAVRQLEASLIHPSLLDVLERAESAVPAAIYRGVVANWHDQLKPRLLDLGGRPGAERASAAEYEAMLADIDAFVEQLNTFVAVLEFDAEARIKRLRQILAIALGLTLALVLAALVLHHRRIFRPLAALRSTAGRIAAGDFAARSEHAGRDELGQLGEAFNAMADELATAYADLERRVEQKTADLTRSNRALELLFHVISRLYHAPASTESYTETLREIEETLGVEGSFACVQGKHGGPAAVLASTLGQCSERDENDLACMECAGRNARWAYRRQGGRDVLMAPLRDADRIYGMLKLALPPGRRLEDWQRDLVEAISRHMGVALGISQQTERERLIALQEERSVIARELHDSLAQSLSYMKIQASLLAPVMADPARRAEAEEILGEIREGINSAYRQLRELLSSFRLKMEGDFARLLANTAEEFSNRSGLPIAVDMRLGGAHLSPNQEIHVLHIIREALSNATRHAGARAITVRLRAQDEGPVELSVEDDGRGIDAAALAQPHHYGVTIMGERARGLGGELEIVPKPGRGTRVTVRFPQDAGPARAMAALPVVLS